MSTLLMKSPKLNRVVRSLSAGVALLLAFSLLMAVPYTAKVTKNSSKASVAIPNELLAKLNKDDIKSYRGDSVRLHTERRSKINKGLARALKTNANRGKTPRWEESMSIQKYTKFGDTKFAHAKAGPSLKSIAPDTITDGDYEMTFITFSGDPDFWDGIVYVRTPYMEETYSGDFLTPSDNGSGWDIVNEVYYPPDGGDPQCPNEQICPIEPILTKAAPANKLKKGKSDVLANHSSAAKSKPLFGWLRNWWGCVTNSCGWAGFLCGGGFWRFFCRVGLCVYSAFWCIFH